jgi:hypothetical protein
MPADIRTTTGEPSNADSVDKTPRGVGEQLGIIDGVRLPVSAFSKFVVTTLQTNPFAPIVTT